MSAWTVTHMDLFQALIEITKILGPIKIIKAFKQTNKSIILKDNRDKLYILKIFSHLENYHTESNVIELLIGIGFGHSPKLIYKFGHSILYEFSKDYIIYAELFDLSKVVEEDKKNYILKHKDYLQNILINLHNLKIHNFEFDIKLYKQQQMVNIKHFLERAITYNRISIGLRDKCEAFANDIFFDEKQTGFLVHGDFNLCNVLVNYNMSDHIIIDWEDANYSNRNIDYATLLLPMIVNRRYSELAIEIIAIIEQFNDYSPRLLIYYLLYHSLIWLQVPPLVHLAMIFIGYLEKINNLNEFNFNECINELWPNNQ